ncbi:MAG: class III extradiol dioxygenase subunit B-like domain-containing protein, partial [Dehalococcoidia bacterium]|nr:class III extradiol dioxygenase subunit B-like domain-containing protein [Dehalococcoidia bacterium]
MCALVFGCITPHPPVLVPEIGGRRVEEVAATTRGLEALRRELAEARPQSLLVVSPHGAYRHSAMGVMTRPSSNGSFDSWGVPGLTFSYDNDLGLVQAIIDEAGQAGVPLEPIGLDGYDLDWGVTVPMYFLGRGAPGVAITPLTYSRLPLSQHVAFGRAIRKAS